MIPTKTKSIASLFREGCQQKCWIHLLYSIDVFIGKAKRPFWFGDSKKRSKDVAHHSNVEIPRSWQIASSRDLDLSLLELSINP